jgi:acetyltransferase-like isoleucine patch superfamily enzyme
MEQKLKDFVKNSPVLLKLYRLVHNGYAFEPSYKKDIKGTGNNLKLDSSALFVKCKFDIVGDNNELIIEDSTFFSNVTFYIRGNNNKIIVSKNVMFNNGGSLWIEDENCEIRIGKYTRFEDVHIAATEPNSKILIGNDCLFAYDIDLRTGDSHSIIDIISNKRINYAQNIIIGNHVWIASHVSILKGANILSNSIVATRSVVTKSFDKENILLGGVPAKILKENITWDKKRIYEV